MSMGLIIMCDVGMDGFASIQLLKQLEQSLWSDGDHIKNSFASLLHMEDILYQGTPFCEDAVK
jgi:hypothetical protein